MDFHRYAEIFPLLDGTAFEELVLDIKTHGLREKIWTYEGKILDGRNRFKACQKSKVKPEYREYKGKDALSFVVSLNVQRRHLNETQRASAAAKIANLRHGGDRRSDQAANLPVEITQAEAAKALHVSERSVRSAKKVQERGSKALNDAMDRGEVSVSKAAEVIDLPKPKQLAAAKESKRDAPASQAQQSNQAGVTIESTGESHEANAPLGASLVDSDEPERPTDMEALDLQAAESFEHERQSSIEKWLQADDKLAAAQKEIERQAAEIVALKTSRDGEINKASEAVKLVKQRDRTIVRLQKDLDRANQELEKLRERIAVMESE